MSEVTPIPAEFNSVSAYLVVPNSVEALEFYAKAFGAEKRTVMPGPGGSTMHAEMKIGNSIVMMSDENPQWHTKSPATLGGSPVNLHVYVNDVDASFQQAIDAGCTVEVPLQDMFWGDRFGKVKDPFGFTWGLASRKENVTPEEMEKRQADVKAAMEKGEPC